MTLGLGEKRPISKCIMIMTVILAKYWQKSLLIGSLFCARLWF